MRILVLGGSGMAGHTITLYFKENGYDVTTFTTKPFPFCENIVGNALDFEKMDSIIRLGNYDVIINCVGILNQYAEEKPDIAKSINSDLPHFIADTIRGLPCKLIHMSTDCAPRGNSLSLCFQHQ